VCEIVVISASYDQRFEIRLCRKVFVFGGIVLADEILLTLLLNRLKML
jgi:hypothetical protein